MIFGGHVEAPASSVAADWIGPARTGPWWTVGALVPAIYPSYVRVRAPDPDVDDWWAAYRSLYEVVGAVGARHASDPSRAWFAVWEGYGWETSTTFYAAPPPQDEAARRTRSEVQARLRAEDAQRHALVRSGLSTVPRFELPHRAYHLVTGPVEAVTELREPGSPHRWQRPDLFWPDDRRWFVATDVDFWSLYVGGDAGFVADLTDAVPTPIEEVSLDRVLETED